MELPYSQQGIILASDYYKDRDRILTVYTRGMGKIRAISRGSRSITSKLAPHLKVLDFVNLMLYDGKSLITITRAAEIESFRNLKNDYEKSAFALYAAELVNSSTLERFPDEEVFNILLSFLKYLDTVGGKTSVHLSGRDAILAFKIKLLDALGLCPIEVTAGDGGGLRIIKEKFSDLKYITEQARNKEKLEKVADRALGEMLNRPVMDFAKYAC